MTRARTPGHTERSTFAACVAHVTSAATSDVPLDWDEQRAWLAERGLGLQGDRYAAGAGTFASGRPGSALTLVDAAVLDTFGRDIDHRRNVVVRGTDLNALIGHEFMLGEALCRGRRLCEPCAYLDRLNGGGILRPLVHRGGLRTDIVCAAPSVSATD